MSVLTPAACVAGIADWLATVDGMGRVHRQRRQLRAEGDLRKYLWDGTRMNGWFIAPAPSTTTVTERHPGFHAIGQTGGGQAVTVFQWQIEAYYAIDDAQDTETTFRDLTWRVADAINGVGLLPIVGLIEQLPSDVDQFGYAAIANFALLHYARIGVGLRGRTRPV